MQLYNLGIAHIRTPVRSPQVNLTARWVRSARAEPPDLLFVCREQHLGRVLAEYVAYSNHSRPQ